jgi:hypothetical protein
MSRRLIEEQEEDKEHCEAVGKRKLREFRLSRYWTADEEQHVWARD